MEESFNGDDGELEAVAEDLNHAPVDMLLDDGLDDLFSDDDDVDDL